jgi:hypothetical protein
MYSSIATKVANALCGSPHSMQNHPSRQEPGPKNQVVEDTEFARPLKRESLHANMTLLSHQFSRECEVVPYHAFWTFARALKFSYI